MDEKQSTLFLGPPDCGQIEGLLSHPLFAGSTYLDLQDFKTFQKVRENKTFFLDIVSAVLQDQSVLSIHRLDLCPQILKKKDLLQIDFLATSFTQNKSILSPFNQIIFHSTPLVIEEKESLDLTSLLQYGLLSPSDEIKKETFLQNYVEQSIELNVTQTSLIRNLVPFQLFLELVPQYTGKKLNFTDLAHRLNIDYKTVQSYFSHFINLNLGFYLQATTEKIRSVQIQSPRFYFFDNGFERALGKQITRSLNTFSEDYLPCFKKWMISEIYKMNLVLNLQLKLSYLETKDGFEIPLIIEKRDRQKIYLNFSNGRMQKKDYAPYLKLLDEKTQFYLIQPEKNLNEFNFSKTGFEFLKLISKLKQQD